MADVVNISPNMNMAVPVPQQSPGPDWAQDLYTALYNVVDQHNHSPGNGVQITPAGININTPLTFNTQNATNLLAAGFTSQGSPLSIATYPAALYVSGGNLYYNSASTQIQLTTPTAVNATSSGITDGTASASFVSSVLVVNAAANTPANIQAGSYRMGDDTADGFFVTLQPPTLSSSYDLTLPSIPGSSAVMQLSSSGVMSASNALPGTITIGSGSSLSPTTLTLGSAGAQLTSDGTTLVTQTGFFPSTIANAAIQALTANEINIVDPSSSTSYPIVVSAQPSTAGLLVIRGSVTGAGSIAAGEGFTVTHPTTGQYQLTWASGIFSDSPIVVGCDASGLAAFTVSMPLSTTATLNVFTFNSSGAAANTPFNFVAVGQRNG